MRILSLDDLVEIYYMSVGRGVNLLLNITPDDHGQVPEAQVRHCQMKAETHERHHEIRLAFCAQGLTWHGSACK